MRHSPENQRSNDDLEARLASERGPNGEPSTNDFQVVELLPIIERFAVSFDELPH